MSVKPKLPDIDTIHQRGHLSVEDLNAEINLQDCDVGIQTATDGRIWICVNGVAFIRFKPHRK